MPKIMLVEDDNNLREIYEARLQAEGFAIVTAHDGEEALVVAKAESPDLVISDVMMPKISGFEMLDILRNTDGTKNIKVIMLTALGQNDDQDRADRLGADKYLVKSQVTLEDIVKVAHQLLEGDSAAPAAVDPASAAPVITSEPVSVVAEPVALATEPATAETTTPEATAPISEPAVVASEEPVAPLAVEPTTVTPIDVVDTSAPAEPSTTELAFQPPVVDTPSPVSDAPVPDAVTTATEEASVEAQIEDFVNNAPLTTPAADPEPVAETSAPESTENTPEDVSFLTPQTEAVDTAPESSPEVLAALSDDKLLADAAAALQTSTETTETATEAVAPTPSEQPIPPETPQSTDVSNPAPIAGKKIISPLDSGPKTDLNSLLAAEEAKEAMAAAAATVISAAPAPTPSPAPGPEDPNNIAL